MSTRPGRKALIAALLPAVLSGCVATAPLPYGEVKTMKAAEASSVSGYLAPGQVWRLDEADLKKLSPAPLVDPPPPPRLPPPPRPSDPRLWGPYYGPPDYAPYYGPSWYFAPSFHYWRW